MELRRSGAYLDKEQVKLLQTWATGCRHLFKRHRNKRGSFFRLFGLILIIAFFIRACYTVDLAPVIKCSYRINNPFSPPVSVRNRFLCSVCPLSFSQGRWSPWFPPYIYVRNRFLCSVCSLSFNQGRWRPWFPPSIYVRNRFLCSVCSLSFSQGRWRPWSLTSSPKITWNVMIA